MGCTGEDGGAAVGDVMITHAQCVAWLRGFADIIDANKTFLTDLDSAIGDADHGTNMARGMKAVVKKLHGAGTPPLGAMFKSAGMTLVGTVGGSSGPLYGTFFMKLGMALGEVEDASLPTFAAALKAGCDGVTARGRTAVGEKTMVDALSPAAEAFEAVVDDGPLAAAEAAAAAARQGRDEGIPLVARKGRASYLGERSAGHQDPGATSATYLFEALATALREG